MELNNIPEAFTLPLRLALISSLINEEKTFNEIKLITKASDGNISVQIKKLEVWGYIESEKRFTGTKNLTFYTITEFGLNKLYEYISLLDKLLKQNNL